MKKQTIFYGILLLMTMSSCVYSLFPIYTEDTLVFKKELLGKWDLGEDGGYLLFETMNNEVANTNAKQEEYKYVIEIKEGFTMSSNDPIFIMRNGKKIYDEDSIKMIMRESLAGTGKKNEKEPASPTLENEREQANTEELDPSAVEYSGSVASYEEKSYRLTISNEEDEKQIYVAHLVQLGDDLFMDLYPIKEYDSKNISDNFFPVHTFYKVEVSESEFKMTHFDLDKLNKLFESNLIRLRHEMVDGTVLITAQPKELQKFISKYAKDESVFDSTETYGKAL